MPTHEPRYLLSQIKLEVTYECPLRCIHCSSEAGGDSRYKMPYVQAMRILNEAIEMNVEEVAFSGGEPLTWPGLESAIGRCASAGMVALVYTCGNVPDPRAATRSLKAAGASRAIFSVYAADPAIHDHITTVKGSHGRTLAAAVEARCAGLETEFHFVPVQGNYRELPSVVAMAQAMGVLQVSVLRFVPQGRGRNAPGMALTHEQNMRLQDMIREGRKRFTIRAGSPYNFLLVNESPACKAAVDRLSIGPDLHIYPCDAFKQVRAEQVVQTDAYSRLDRWSLQECWVRSPYLQAVRQYLDSPFTEPCAGCRLLRQCLSGCLAQKYLANGILAKAPDPMCLMACRGGDGSCDWRLSNREELPGAASVPNTE